MIVSDRHRCWLFVRKESTVSRCVLAHHRVHGGNDVRLNCTSSPLTLLDKKNSAIPLIKMFTVLPFFVINRLSYIFSLHLFAETVQIGFIFLRKGFKPTITQFYKCYQCI